MRETEKERERERSIVDLKSNADVLVRITFLYGPSFNFLRFPRAVCPSPSLSPPPSSPIRRETRSAYISLPPVLQPLI